MYVNAIFLNFNEHFIELNMASSIFLLIVLHYRQKKSKWSIMVADPDSGSYISTAI
jgi:hypothetical protein